MSNIAAAMRSALASELARRAVADGDSGEATAVAPGDGDSGEAFGFDAGPHAAAAVAMVLPPDRTTQVATAESAPMSREDLAAHRMGAARIAAQKQSAAPAPSPDGAQGSKPHYAPFAPSDASWATSPVDHSWMFRVRG